MEFKLRLIYASVINNFGLKVQLKCCTRRMKETKWVGPIEKLSISTYHVLVGWLALLEPFREMGVCTIPTAHCVKLWCGPKSRQFEEPCRLNNDEL